MGLAIARPAGAGDHEAQVFGELDVVVQDLWRQSLASQDRLDDPPDPRLAEPVDQRVEVGVPPLDQNLFGLLDDRRGHRDGRIRRQLFYRLPGQRIDQPGMPAGQLEGEGLASEVKAWPVSAVCCS